MSIESVLAEGRYAAEARMRDACTVREASGKPVYDPATGTTSSPEGEVVYSGKCEIKVTGLTVQEAAVGGTEVGLRSLTVKLPLSATGVRRNHVVTVDVATTDPDLAGRKYRVEASEAETYATCRRLQVEEVS